MLYAAVIHSVLRRRRRFPRRFANTPPLWRLLLGEAAAGARRLVRGTAPSQRAHCLIKVRKKGWRP